MLIIALTLFLFFQERKLKKVTTNSIRKATQTGAMGQPMEVQRAISKHLAHSLETAHANYQATTPAAVQSRFNHVRMIQLNQRVLKRGLEDVAAGVFATCPFPRFDEFRQSMAEDMGIPDLKLDKGIYDQVRGAFLASRRNL